MKTRHLLSCLLLLCFAFSCKQPQTVQADQAALEFAEALYNLDYVKATELSTVHSTIVVRLIASNITQEHIDLVKQNGKAKVTLVRSSISPDGSQATVILKVKNFLQLDLVKERASIEKEEEIALNMVQVNGKWLTQLRN